MTTPSEITIEQQRIQNVRSALYELRSRGIMNPDQIHEARGFIAEGSTCIENVIISGMIYDIYGLSQMITPHGDILSVEDKEDYNEYFFSTLDSFIKWLDLKLFE